MNATPPFLIIQTMINRSVKYIYTFYIIARFRKKVNRFPRICSFGTAKKRNLDKARGACYNS